MASLKEQKELFVTGHAGTTPWEILLVSAAAPIGIWLFQSLRALEHYVQDNPKHATTTRTRTTNMTTTSTTITSIGMEALVLWLPFLICQTNLLYPWGAILLCAEVQMCILVYVYFWSTKRWMAIRKMENHAASSSLETVDEDAEALPDIFSDTKNDQLVHTQRLQIMKDAMTVYRSSMLYMTFVAILAVDFHIFPRRFAKTEVAGYGLMDLGAGSFVVAAGLVSPRARHLSSSSPNKQSISFGKKDMIRILPLLIIGFIRLATNKGLEYQEHVSEYGVHWNFFFTLTVVTTLGSVLPGRPNWMVPACLITGYQIALTKYGGQDFIENAARTHCSSAVLSELIGDSSSSSSSPLLQQLCTLYAANREGILGCIGYLFLFLSSEYLAYAQLWTTTSKNGNGPLWILTGSLWGFLYIMVELLEIPVSRRSTNASFCIWTLAHNMVLLAAIHTSLCLYKDPQKIANMPKASEVGTRPRVPVVFQAVNRHGLLAFLVANLLTGLTNISINTLAVSDSVAIMVLFVYLCAVGGFALVLHHVIHMHTVSRCNKIEKEEGKAKME